MKGVIEREKLQRLAQLAVDHFQEVFDVRKEKTLARLADREYGLFFKKKRGMEWAEEIFARSAYDAGGSSSGQLWAEYKWLTIAKNLLEVSEVGSVSQFILDDDELNVIWAVSEDEG